MNWCRYGSDNIENRGILFYCDKGERQFVSDIQKKNDNYSHIGYSDTMCMLCDSIGDNCQ